MRIAIIGGTGVYDPAILTDVQEAELVTPYGTINYLQGRYEDKEVFFLARHGSGHSVPPHRINYRANIWGLKMLGVTEVIATAAVGSLNQEMPPGEMVLLDQFIDFTKDRVDTFYDGGPAGVVHVDYTEPYCPRVRAVLLAAAKEAGITLIPRGTYVCTEGPRYETPAEIKAYAVLGGDLVGMTNVPEVVLAREAGLCYATVAMVTNWAAGISPHPLTHREVVEIMDRNTEKLRRLLMRAISGLSEDPDCACHHATRELGQF
ncbi:MAG: S-methyl-5'-thioadenosine phosphorylase [Firmicutes bacterium]|nr:S-methyl-5'-thioadenosine phosphorylase [Bacillota bacterium]